MMIKKGGGGTKKIITDVYDYKGEDRETLSMCCRARLNACLKRKSRLPCLQSTRHRESNVRINKEKGESLCTPPILTIQVGVVYCAVCVPSARWEEVHKAIIDANPRFRTDADKVPQGGGGGRWDAVRKKNTTGNNTERNNKQTNDVA